MSATQQLLRFGVFELNLDSGELRKSGTAIKLPPQSFRLLALLASRAGQVVTREDIQKQLWGEETFVDFEHGVNKCINQIRASLNDSADKPLYVETIPRYGYRFLAPVRSKTVVVPPPRVTESNSGITVIAEHVLARIAATTAVSPVSPAVPASTVAVAQPPEVVPVTKAGLRFPRQWKLLTGLLVVAVMLAAGGLYWQSHRQQPLTKKVSIVLGDFRNSHGEIVDNDKAKETLSAALRQSPLLDILPQEKVASAFKRMSWPAHTPLTPAVAREICRQVDGDASIVGKIFSEEGRYVVTLRATDCKSGQVAAYEEATTSAKERVLDALGAAAAKLGGELGELLRKAASAKAVVPEGWYVSGSKPAEYEAGTDEHSLYNDHPSAYLKSKGPVEDGFGTLMQDFSADKYLGKRVRLSALARSEGVRDWAGLWMRVESSPKSVSIDNMEKRPIKGTTGWQNYVVVLDVPQDANDIFFGILLGGSGAVWLNSVKFEVVGSEVPTTGTILTQRSEEPRDEPANLAFQH